MAIPKKGSRKITVGGREYRWIAREVPEGTRIFIGPTEGNWQTLSAHFDRVDEWEEPGRAFQLTPFIVKKILEYGLRKGWNPAEGGGTFVLGDVTRTVEGINLGARKSWFILMQWEKEWQALPNGPEKDELMSLWKDLRGKWPSGLWLEGLVTILHALKKRDYVFSEEIIRLLEDFRGFWKHYYDYSGIGVWNILSQVPPYTD